jgi:hypothetical protein
MNSCARLAAARSPVSIRASSSVAPVHCLPADYARAFEDRALKGNGGGWNRLVVHIDYRANNNSSLWPGCFRQWNRLLLSLGDPRFANGEHEYEERTHHFDPRLREIFSMSFPTTNSIGT